MIPVAKFIILGKQPDGSVIECFRWTRSAETGIDQAWRDAAKFGVELTDIWAEPIPMPVPAMAVPA